MSGQHDVGDILRRIDNVLEVAAVQDTGEEAGTVTSTRHSDLARPLAEATGLSTIVVSSSETDGEAAAIQAAMAARDAFLPGFVVGAIKSAEGDR